MATFRLVQAKIAEGPQARARWRCCYLHCAMYEPMERKRKKAKATEHKELETLKLPKPRREFGGRLRQQQEKVYALPSKLHARHRLVIFLP
jgi:hypothetical protein